MHTCKQISVPQIEENRFSIYVKTPSDPEYTHLVRWLDWFLNRGIPAVLASNNSGYAVYRTGLVEVPKESRYESRN